MKLFSKQSNEASVINTVRHLYKSGSNILSPQTVALFFNYFYFYSGFLCEMKDLKGSQ